MTEKWGVGDKAKDEPFATTSLENGEPLELIYGEHPHSRSDNYFYARTSDGIIYEFNGHYILIDIKITSSNCLKLSDLSGDEIRKSVYGYIIADKIRVYEVSGRDVENVLLKIYYILGKLREYMPHWLDAKSRNELPGRRIWYHDQPAVIQSIIESQGCVLIECNKGFKPPPWNQRSFRNYWEDGDDRYIVKEDIFSPHIWWWRDTE